MRFFLAACLPLVVVSTSSQFVRRQPLLARLDAEELEPAGAETQIVLASKALHTLSAANILVKAACDAALARGLSPINESYVARRFEKPKIEVVTARCGENISWIDAAMGTGLVQSVYVYDKCGKTETDRTLAGTPFNLVRLANTGRESVAHIHHMLELEDREDAPDVIVFTQGGLEMRMEVLQEWLQTCAETGCCQHMPMLHFPANHPFFIQRDAGDVVCTCVTALTDSVPLNECLGGEGMWFSLRGEFMTTTDNVRRMLADPNTRAIMDSLYEALHMSNNPLEGHILERLWRSLLEPRSELYALFDCEATLGNKQES